MAEHKHNLSTDPYKGVRDFYPEDMFIQNYIFGVMKKTVEKFGYSEYAASVLEPTELYTSKTSDEIVNEQTYTFTDRGDRSVTLRPEMTPTAARMVAAQERELGFPLRWYSIPNVFRYEQPQRGRLREHWQLNVDIFGSHSLEADVEIISIAHALLLAFGAEDKDFEIHINSRKLLQALYKKLELSDEIAKKLTQLLDRKNKIPQEEFVTLAKDILGDVSESFFQVLAGNILEYFPNDTELIESYAEIHTLKTILSSRNIKVLYDPAIVRGFTYYTGIVFEVFDTNPANKRSIFGGGRYDNLTEHFGGNGIPAMGFGAGDVTIHDFLETHSLLPSYHSASNIYIGVLNHEFDYAHNIAEKLRAENINVFVCFEDFDMRDHFKLIEKRNIPLAIFIGTDEKAHARFTIRTIATKELSPIFEEANIQDIIAYIKNLI